MDPSAGSVAAFETEARMLCEIGRLFGERQWCLATGGNFSVRVGAEHCLITRSGADKARMTLEDLGICDLNGLPAEAGLRPSAETAVHTCLYALDEDIGAVLHTHSVTSTVISRQAPGDLVLSGYEMQKAIDGIRSHDEKLILPVLENSQDMRDIAAATRERHVLGHLRARGFLVRGHGLYAWGADLAAAKRHVEGLEFLLSCALEERKLAR